MGVMGAMRLRNPLFAPGDSARKMEKALASVADAVILDLEDSVAEGQKAAAREMVRAMLPGVSRAGVVVRVNPVGTAHHLADLAAVVAGRPAAIMLPKCNGGGQLAVLDRQLAVLEAAAGVPEGSIGVLPIATETAASVLALGTLATGLGAGAPRLAGLCFGAEDLAADLGTAPRHQDGAYPAATVTARGLLLLAAAACGVPALDTPWPDPRDPEGLWREARAAAADGFAGKLCIHPDQVGPVAEVFTPDRMRLDWARRVVAGFAANPGAGVFALDGKMIDRPHLRLAERLLALGGQEPAAE
jgi:citrate lyase subunit beta / citryl-CoA lyase